jgi:hypothetical protein
MIRTFLMLSPFVLSACVDGKECFPYCSDPDSNEEELDTAEEEEEEGEEEELDTAQEEEESETTTSVSWAAGAVTLDIANGDETASYNWGLTENVGSCIDDGWCWTGEDCHTGYNETNGGNILYCHPVSSSGGSLSYGASCDSSGCDVIEGSTTVFDDGFSDKITHILDNEASTEDGSCWVWGADTSYYDGFPKGCVNM